MSIALTIEDLKSLIGAQASPSEDHPFIGKYVIIRSYASGVHAGTLVAKDGREVLLEGSRRLWLWDVKEHGISLSEVANHGPDGKRARICEVLPRIAIQDAIEVIPATKAAEEVINSAPVYKHNG